MWRKILCYFKNWHWARISWKVDWFRALKKIKVKGESLVNREAFKWVREATATRVKETWEG